MKSQKCRFHDCSWNQLSYRANLQKPVSADLLCTFRNIGSLQIFNSDLVDFFFIVLREAQSLDSFKYIDPKFFDNFHDIGKLQSMKFLNNMIHTALEVSWSSLQAWIAIWRLPTLSFSFHFIFNYLFILSKIFMYVFIEIVVLFVMYGLLCLFGENFEKLSCELDHLLWVLGFQKAKY